MSDEIRRLTELLAHDPSNLAFRQLAELLRQRGELDAAHRVAIRGLERHTLDSEAHALLARICVDRGELQRAFDEWDMALRLSPRHVGALKGLGFISYRWGRLDEAERYLKEGIAISRDDESLISALESVQKARAALSGFHPDATAGTPAPRPRTPSPVGNAAAVEPTPASRQPAATSQPQAASRQPQAATPGGLEAMRAEWSRPSRKASPSDVFREVTGDSELQALLVDPDGLIIAGRFLGSDGHDRAPDVGAELSGVSDEANRAMRHLRLGEWKSISFESESAVVSMARAGEKGDALVVVAAPRSAPLGLLRRVLERAQRTAAQWLDGAQ